MLRSDRVMATVRSVISGSVVTTRHSHRRIPFETPHRCSIVLVALCAILSFAAFSVSAASLEVVRVLGGEEDDDVILHHPMSVAFGPDGSAYILNAGDCTILSLDSDWEPLGRFGREGEGPGEFTQPTGLILHEDALWVFGISAIVKYGLDGAYLGTIRTEYTVHGTTSIDGRIFVKLGTSGRAGARIDSKGEIDLLIGPDCPPDNPDDRHRVCGVITVLPHPEHLCVMVNPLLAEVLAIGDDGSVTGKWTIPDGPGEFRVTRSGGVTQSSMRLMFSISFRDSRGRYWKLKRPMDGRTVRLLDEGFEETGVSITIPEEMRFPTFAESPRGEILAIQMYDSRIFICRLVEE